MEIATARYAPIVSAASFSGNYPTFKGTASIWNWSTGECLSEFPTVFDGMGRHALSPNGELYVAANWRKGKSGGVACYNTRTGERIWHQPDLRQVQRIRFSAEGDKVWCCVDRRPVHCLDSRTGLILTKLRGVEEVIESRFTDVVLHSRKGAYCLIVGGETIEVPRLAFSMSDADFSSDTLGLAEYSGPVRFIGCESGKERWRYVPPQGFHVIKISYQADQCFYGLLFGYGIPETALIRLSPDNGVLTEFCRYSALKRYGGVSYGGGDFGDGSFVTGEGDLVSLADGGVLRQLAFPVRSDHRPPSPLEA